MQVVGTHKKLLDYFNENNTFIQITEDDVVQIKREYDKDLQTAFTWFDAEKDGWKIICEHQGHGNLGYDNQEIIITMKKKEKVGDFFGQDNSQRKSLHDAIMEAIRNK